MSSPMFQSATPDPGSHAGAPHQLEMKLMDLDLIEKICSQALIDVGFVKEVDGLTLADDKQLKQAVVQIMLDHHVVTNQNEMASLGVTKFELYSEVLPTAPGVVSLPNSLESEAAKSKLMNKVWGFTNTGVSGHVQDQIAHSGYLVVEAQVDRTKVSKETGKTDFGTEMARFLTASGDLIMTHLTQPAGAKFLAQARKLENLLGMVTERRPELVGPIAQQLGVVLSQAVASIPHADAKRAAALTAGLGTGESSDA